MSARQLATAARDLRGHYALMSAGYGPPAAASSSSPCCLCCVAAAERGELDHVLGAGCPHPPCDWHQPGLVR